MKKQIFITKLYIYFWYYILRPFRKVYNLFIKHSYIIKNDRNQQIINYCTKLLTNKYYQPSTPVEHWVDMQWEKDFIAIRDRYYPYFQNEQYETYRQLLAVRIGCRLQEYFMLKERE